MPGTWQIPAASVATTARTRRRTGRRSTPTASTATARSRRRLRRSRTAPRYGVAVSRGDAPFLIHAHVDADPAAPRHPTLALSLIFDAQRARRQIQQVLPQVDAKRFRQVAGPATEIRGGRVARLIAAAAHQREAIL